MQVIHISNNGRDGQRASVFKQLDHPKLWTNIKIIVQKRLWVIDIICNTHYSLNFLSDSLTFIPSLTWDVHINGDVFRIETKHPLCLTEYRAYNNNNVDLVQIPFQINPKCITITSDITNSHVILVHKVHLLIIITQKAVHLSICYRSTHCGKHTVSLFHDTHGTSLYNLHADSKSTNIIQ